MNRLLRYATVVLVALLAVTLLPVTVAAQQCSFYGTVKVNGASVPAGTSVTAWMDGEQVAETTTTMVGPNSYYFLDVDGEYENEGDEVSFKIGALWADQVGYWIPFGAEQTNLTATSVVPPTLMEGDATLNKHVTGADALLIAQYVVGPATLTNDQKKCADTTDDGSVTGSDALHIAQWVVDPTGGAGVLKKPLWQSPADDDMLPPAP
jgi:hypothetical protein